jgi:hypothetical protein
LNSLRLVEDIRSSSLTPYFWTHKNGRAYYRWLESLVSQPTPLFEHVKAHTGHSDFKSKLNDSADSLARSARSGSFLVPLFPTPTFAMNDYSLNSERDGWIESDAREYIDLCLTQRVAISPSCALSRHPVLLYDSHTPPSYPYEHAYSAYSARVQLQTRSGQLPTQSRLCTRKLSPSAHCRMDCGCRWEDEHHIFVYCSAVQYMRTEAVKSLLSDLSDTLGKLSKQDCDDARYLINHIFEDDRRCWNSGVARFYIGHVPSVAKFVLGEGLRGEVQRSRIVAQIASFLHSASIRLAGRIWGAFSRASTIARATLDLQR